MKRMGIKRMNRESEGKTSMTMLLLVSKTRTFKSWSMIIHCKVLSGNSMILENDALHCPPPYMQNDETVRLCGASRKPCQSKNVFFARKYNITSSIVIWSNYAFHRYFLGDEKCIRVSTLSVCCKRPSLIAMKSFMRAVCGIGYNA